MDNIQFQESVVDKIQGWLIRVASLRTMDILAYQEEAHIMGPLLEIGVFCGKYLSVLARSAQRSNSRLLGIDTFQWLPESRVMEELSRSEETNRVDVRLWKRFSHECSPQEIIAELQGKPRFISIDGSHEYEDVYLDLELSEHLISNQGIIAIDDFLNPLALGVNEAAHKFFARPRSVIPIAHISNKLFVSHRSLAKAYREVIEKATMEDKTEPESKNFRESLAKARYHVEQPLWGHPVLLS